MTSTMGNMARALVGSVFVAMGIACSAGSSALDETPSPPMLDDAGDEADSAALPTPDGGALDSSVRDADAADVSDASTIVPGPAIVAAKTSCPVTYRASGPVPGANTGFSVSGQERSFHLWVPPASFTGPRPLLFAFHGTGGSGLGFASGTQLAELAAKGFIVVAPNGAGNGTIWPVWDALRLPGTETAANADLDFVDALLACTAAHREVDASRVFVAGFSAGGSFTNKVLRARSSVLAGGIVLSGVFSLTGNGGSAPLDDMFVIVAWGGDNDIFNGASSGPLAIQNFQFAEEAAVASQYYEGQANVAQLHCRGPNVGHGWLPPTSWLAESFLTHPKGASTGAVAQLPSSCSTSAASIAPLGAISCGASTTSGCQAYCQLMADCVGENRTVGGVLQSQLATAGISPSSCGGCLTKCQQSTGAGKAAVLSCFAGKSSAQCGPGVDGSLPFANAVDTCCSGRTDSTLCVDLCTSLNQAGAAAKLFTTCQAIAP